MEVVRARVLGFCMGVRRAVEIAVAQARANGPGVGGRIYTIGPLIHNPQVLAELKSSGIEILETDGGKAMPYLSGSTVLIRAHGISPEIEKRLISGGAKVIDATCPHVKASQMNARSLSGQGFTVFLAGEKAHGEIKGIRSYINGECFIAADPAEAEALASELAGRKPNAKTALIGQTTLSPEEYSLIEKAIKNHFPSLKVCDTICGATRERQNALKELSGRVGAFVIAGGRDSANTRRLLSIASGCGKKAWLAENAASLPPEVFDYAVIGLAAGASTPDETIDEIEAALLTGKPQSRRL